MKKTLTLTLTLVLLLSLLLACAPAGYLNVWQSATYTEDTTLGEGEKTVYVTISAENKEVKLTVLTDEDNLGSALFALELVNDPSFFDTINGMRLDWDETNAYWSLVVDGQYASYGISDAPIHGGEEYRIEMRR